MSGHNSSGNFRSRGDKRSPNRTRSRSRSYKRSKLSSKSLEDSRYKPKYGARQFKDLLVCLFLHSH